MADALPDLKTLLASEAAADVAIAEAMASVADHAVAHMPLGQGALIALGPGRFVNRAVGVGPDLDDDDLDTIEQFYAMAGQPAAAQISSHANEETLARLSSRTFRPRWFRGVFARPIPSPVLMRQIDTDIDIGPVSESNLDQWLHMLCEGNEVIGTPIQPRSEEHGRAAHAAVGSIDMLAFSGGVPVGCGSIQMADGIAWLGGAATIPSRRGQGIQGALIRHRVGVAAALGCTTIAAMADRHSGSARNLMREGLQLVDVQLAMEREGG
jgi:GNAT superfamily N-acetyltransferase